MLFRTVHPNKEHEATAKEPIKPPNPKYTAKPKPYMLGGARENRGDGSVCCVLDAEQGVENKMNYSLNSLRGYI